MAQATKVTKRELLKVAADLLKLPMDRIWAEYDEEADVLYLSFRKPQDAKDSVLEDDIIITTIRKSWSASRCSTPRKGCNYQNGR